MSTTRKSYPSDVADAEWEFLLPYLTLMREDAPQREYALRDLFNAMRYVIKTGCQWRYLPHDFPPWAAVYQQARRWLDAQVFEHAAHDLREMIRLTMERGPHPTAVIMDGRTLSRTELVICGMIVIGLAGYLSDRVVVAIGNWLLRWSPTHHG